MVKGNGYHSHFKLFLEMFYLSTPVSGFKGKKKDCFKLCPGEIGAWSFCLEMESFYSHLGP